MSLCSVKECTGCAACVNICNHQAIEMIENSEGFLRPVINNDRCTKCGLCERVCPVIHPLNKEKTIKKQYGYACWTNDKKIRRASSSGGFFSEVAKSVLLKGGYVVGAAFDDDFVLRHIIIDDILDLSKLRGSKYIQSRIDNVYIKIKKLLHAQKSVLFTGTPCQVAGLHCYLGKEYDNLTTIDFVCHGVPSPLLFRKYKIWLEQKYNDRLKSFHFRDKRRSWMWFNTKAIFNSQKTYYGTWFKDPFMRLFLRDNPLRECCYNCHYTNMNRIGDITIADYWGYKATSHKEKNTDKGISMVLINSVNAERLVEGCKRTLTAFGRSVDEISRSQKSLSSSWNRPPERDVFWQDVNTLAFSDVINKYGYPQKRSFREWAISEYGKNVVTETAIFISRVVNKIIEITKNFLR